MLSFTDLKGEDVWTAIVPRDIERHLLAIDGI